MYINHINTTRVYFRIQQDLHSHYIDLNILRFQQRTSCLYKVSQPNLQLLWLRDIVFKKSVRSNLELLSHLIPYLLAI